MECVVFRCSRQAEVYVYVRADVDTADLPPELLARLGDLSPVMDLQLSAERKLAQADPAEVIRQLGDKGFYLQLPPRDRLNAHLYRGD